MNWSRNGVNNKFDYLLQRPTSCSIQNSKRARTKLLTVNQVGSIGTDYFLFKRAITYDKELTGQVILSRNIVALQDERVVAHITTACSTFHATNFSVAS